MSQRYKEIIYVCCLTGFITITFAFGRYIFAMITPDIVSDLNLDYEFIGRINALHQCAYLIFALLGGFLCSFVSVRFLISSSVILCGVSLTILSFVDNQWVLLVIITIQGIFAATSWIPMVEFVSENIQEKNRGKSLGIISSGTSYGLILNGILIPVILTYYTWQKVWLVFGIISLILGVIGVYWMYTLQDKKYQEKDAKKQIETKDQKHMIAKRNVTDGYWRHYILLIILLILSGLYLIPFQSYIVPLMQEDFGINEQIAGICWSLFGIIGIFSGLIAGILADKYSAKKAMIIAYGVSVVAIAVIVIFRNAAGVLFACAIFGLTYNGIFGLHPTYVSRIMPPEKTAKLFGILNLALGLGSMVGNYICGYIKEESGSFILDYQLMLVMSFLAALICFFIKEDKTRSQV